MSDYLSDPFETPPRDVVDPAEPTREQRRERLLSLDAAVGTAATFTHPPRVHLDVDGIPAGIEALRTEPTLVQGAIIARHELTQAGLTETDVPNLRIIDPPTKEQ